MFEINIDSSKIKIERFSDEDFSAELGIGYIFHGKKGDVGFDYCDENGLVCPIFYSHHTDCYDADEVVEMAVEILKEDGDFKKVEYIY